MSLLKYYKLKENLPKPDGPLSHYISSSSILAANEELSKVTSSENGDNTKANTVDAGKRALILLIDELEDSLTGRLAMFIDV